MKDYPLFFFFYRPAILYEASAKGLAYFVASKVISPVLIEFFKK